MHRVWHCCENRFTEALSCFTIVVCCHALLCLLCCVSLILLCFTVLCCHSLSWEPLHCCGIDPEDRECNTVLHCCVVSLFHCWGSRGFWRKLRHGCDPDRTLFTGQDFLLGVKLFFFMLKKKYRNWVRNINIIGIKLSDNDNDVSNPPFGPFDCQLYTCHWSAENESFVISFIVCFCVTNCDPSDCFKWDPLT